MGFYISFGECNVRGGTQKTQNPEGQRKGTSKDLYRPYLRPTSRGVSMLFFLEPKYHCDRFLSCRAKVKQNYDLYIVLYLGVYTVPTLLG